MRLPPVPNLAAALTRLIEQIPPGCVATCGDLADALGDRTAARWVGEWLADHPHDASCACHRVVRKTGCPGSSPGATIEERLSRLQLEGVTVANGVVNVDRHVFRAFRSDRPLAVLREFQESLPAQVREEPLAPFPDQAAAVDLAYDKSGGGAAALAVVETSTGRLVDSAVLRGPIGFPYITGYLTFREVGLMRDIVESRAERPTVLLVDGNGRLHPRRAGIATTLGLLLDLPTIGVGKRLLTGRIEPRVMGDRRLQTVVEGEEILGAELNATGRSNPIYVSIGHRIDLPGAVALCERLFHGHRLPEPLYQADRLSKEAARS